MKKQISFDVAWAIVDPVVEADGDGDGDALQLRAPFPYFGGKSRAASLVWSRFGAVKNYVEPFCGSAAMLLAAPPLDALKTRIETINDSDGFVANFWRAVRCDPEAVAAHADYPVIEADLEARHAWLVNRAERLRWQLEDPDFYDAKIAGWWVWGACAWIGSGWCSGMGPHMTNGARLFDRRKLPHVGNAGRGINRKLPHLSAGRGINRQLPHLSTGRASFIRGWMVDLSTRLRHVRVASGDWQRVLSRCVTTRHGLTAVFLDPPYAKGSMDYAAGGVGTSLSADVARWCAENGNNERIRIALCCHADEHAMPDGWTAGTWKAGGGYAKSAESVERRKSETIWFSPHCLVPA